MKAVFDSLIPKLPDLRVLLVGNGNSVGNIEELAGYLGEFGGSIDIISFEDLKVEKENVKVISVIDSASKIGINTRGYEVLFILDVYEDLEDKVSFLKTLYHAVENSGNVFILLSKEKYSFWSAKEELDEANFVAASEIELDDDYSLIYAKKMHGWGGGM